jgi:hypothetical protein
MKTAQEMLQEMYEAGLTEQAIANLTIPAADPGAGPLVSQAQVHRLRSGDRKDPRASTWGAVNDAYLKWKADNVLGQNGKARAA